MNQSTITMENCITNFKTTGIRVLKSMSLDQLGAILEYANNCYYNEDPVMTDTQFDIMKEYTDFLNESKNPNSLSPKVGAPVNKQKATLPYFMASMNKIKPDTDSLQRWKLQYGGPYIVTPKLDGVSGMYVCDISGNRKLYTRGNGSIGQDISYLIPHLQLLPLCMPEYKQLVIRGEFIMKKSVFKKKYIQEFENVRNMVAGIINRKSVDPNVVKDIDFVAYEIVDPPLRTDVQMSVLQTLSINSVPFSTMIDGSGNACLDQKLLLSNDNLSELVVSKRIGYEYDIDGIIVANVGLYERTTENPKSAFAFKMVLTDQSAEAKVVDVIWTASKDGFLKPRVQIEPVCLCGVRIEFATGFNAKFIQSNNIGIGALVRVIRSNDVIPKIEEVIVAAPEAKMPIVNYVWNETGVDILLGDDELAGDVVVIEKRLYHFFKTMGTDFMGPGNIRRLIEGGYDTIPKILALTVPELFKVDGFQETMSEKVVNSIRKSMIPKRGYIWTLMAASGVFGRGMGMKKLMLVIESCPSIIGDVSKCSGKLEHDLTTSVANIRGMSYESATEFVLNIPIYLDFLKSCNLWSQDAIVFSKDDDSDHNAIGSSSSVSVSIHPLYARTVVFTGCRPSANLSEEMTKTGVNASGGSVTKDTSIVVYNKPETNGMIPKSGKTDMARQREIPLMSLDEFTKKYYS